MFVLLGPSGSQTSDQSYEVFGPCEMIKEVVDSGNRVPVSDCDFIQGSIINPDSPCSIFLLY
jgi:hypothetical protein